MADGCAIGPARCLSHYETGKLVNKARGGSATCELARPTMSGQEWREKAGEICDLRFLICEARKVGKVVWNGRFSTNVLTVRKSGRIFRKI